MGYNEDSDTWGTLEGVCKDRVDACLGGVIYGLTLSTAGSSSTFGIAAGGANGMSLASAYTKTTSSWALGTAAGALDTGAIANSTWYHVWLIERIDVSPTVTDVLISLSATAPTMPTNYTRKRRIGAMKTNGSAQWTAFTQSGDMFTWTTIVNDANGVTVPTSWTNLTQTVPTGVVVIPLFTLVGMSPSAGVLNIYLGNGGATTQSMIVQSQNNAKSSCSVQFLISNTSAQIAWTGDSSVTTTVDTTGWIDTRGK